LGAQPSRYKIVGRIREKWRHVGAGFVHAKVAVSVSVPAEFVAFFPESKRRNKDETRRRFA